MRERVLPSEANHKPERNRERVGGVRVVVMVGYELWESGGWFKGRMESSSETSSNQSSDRNT